ncbi:MAG: tripartite tricarboxylate transporter substrate binding protein [Burkholderiales bacterium]
MKNQSSSTSNRLLPLPTRRAALHASAAAALGAGLGMLGLPAAAQSFPNRPLRMVIAFPAAGATDILARLVAQAMGGPLGQSVVVENKPGAGGMIGMDAAAKMQPDGHNLFLCAITNTAIAGHLYAKATADITNDFEPIALLANGAHILNVHPSVPARNMAEFGAWLKANDGNIDYASQGNGTLSHLEAELLQQRLGVKAVHIPYKGSSQALPDLVSGKVSFMFDSVAASQPFIKAGQLRALAVATSKRVPAFPDLPTIAEAGVTGYDADNWFGLFAPKGTPAAAIELLGQTARQVLTDAAVVDSLEQKGYVVTPSDSAALADLVASDRAKWGAVIKAANVTI